MVSPLLRVIQSNNNGWVSKKGDKCWSGLKSFRDRDASTRRRTLFIFKRTDGKRDFALFDSEWTGCKNAEDKYVFEIVSSPVILRSSDFFVHLMSPRELKWDAVDLVERLGK
jgi:hypothetical protein